MIQYCTHRLALRGLATASAHQFSRLFLLPRRGTTYSPNLFVRPCCQPLGFIQGARRYRDPFVVRRWYESTTGIRTITWTYNKP